MTGSRAKFLNLIAAAALAGAAIASFAALAKTSSEWGGGGAVCAVQFCGATFF